MIIGCKDFVAKYSIGDLVLKKEGDPTLKRLCTDRVLINGLIRVSIQVNPQANRRTEMYPAQSVERHLDIKAYIEAHDADFETRPKTF